MNKSSAGQQTLQMKLLFDGLHLVYIISQNNKIISYH